MSGNSKNKQKKINVRLIAKELIKNRIIEFFKKPKILTFSPLGIIFPKERYTHSRMAGLMTSLGEKFWEALAVDLAIKNNFIIKNKKEFMQNVPVLENDIKSIINNFQNDRLKKKSSINELSIELKKILTQKERKTKKIEKGEGIDLWLEKNNTEYMFDIKTVQVNAGTGSKLSRNMCNWHAYRIAQNQKVNLITACVFPYDPHNGKFWEKEGGKISPMVKGEDALLGDEFWSLITGQKNSMNEIIKAFEDLKKDKSLEEIKSNFQLEN